MAGLVWLWQQGSTPPPTAGAGPGLVWLWQQGSTPPPTAGAGPGLVWLWQRFDLTPPPPLVGPVVYMRPPAIPEDDKPRMSTMDICIMWIGAQQSGIAASPVVR